MIACFGKARLYFTWLLAFKITLARGSMSNYLRLNTNRNKGQYSKVLCNFVVLLVFFANKLFVSFIKIFI